MRTFSEMLTLFNNLSTQLTALHFAALYDKSGLGVTALIEAGAPINAFNSWNRAPLHLAGELNPVAVPILLAGGADPNILDKNNETPLLWAALANFTESVTAMLNAGADPNIENVNGTSPLNHPDVPQDIKDLMKNHSN